MQLEAVVPEGTITGMHDGEKMIDPASGYFALGRSPLVYRWQQSCRQPLEQGTRHYTNIDYGVAPNLGISSKLTPTMWPGG